MGHSVVERFRCGVLCQAQDVATVDARESARAGDQQEAEGAQAPKGEGVGPLRRAGLGRGDGLELEAAQKIVGEDTQVLPGTVRAP
jgi:hypothetical protein